MSPLRSMVASQIDDSELLVSWLSNIMIEVARNYLTLISAYMTSLASELGVVHGIVEFISRVSFVRICYVHTRSKSWN
jgi:hypothetical protein